MRDLARPTPQPANVSENFALRSSKEPRAKLRIFSGPGILLRSGRIYVGQGESSLAEKVRNESPYAQVDDALELPLENSSSPRNDRPSVPADAIPQQFCRKPVGVTQTGPALDSWPQANDSCDKLAGSDARLLGIPGALACDLRLRRHLLALAFVHAPSERRRDSGRPHYAIVRGPV